MFVRLQWIVLATIILAGCEQAGSAQAGKTERASETASAMEWAGDAPRTHKKPSADPLAEEALAKSWEFFEQSWRRCDDSYITAITYAPTGKTVVTRYVQLKEVTFKPPRHAMTLTEADRLNAVEWKGIIEVRFSAMREYDNHEIERRWGDWELQKHERHPNLPLLRYAEIPLVKRAGRWKVDTSILIEDSEKLPDGDHGYKQDALRAPFARTLVRPSCDDIPSG